MKILFRILVINIVVNSVAVHAARKACSPLYVKNGQVVTRSNGRITKVKCNRGFTIVGEPYNACIKGRWDAPKPLCIKRGCKLRDLRNGHMKTSYDGAFVEFSCDPGFRLIGPDFIYCDGISWNAMEPYCQATDISCNFERQNTCNWVNEKKVGDELIWQIQEMAAPSRLLRTGPAHDHTYLANSSQKGHYLMIETSDPGSDYPSPARIHSPRFFPIIDNSCFVFWYHMFGTTVGRLNVFLNNGLVFHEKGNHGDSWNKGVIPLSIGGSSDFQITMEATYGGGYTGDIAVDDFSVGTGVDCISPKDLSCEGRCYEESNTSSVCHCSPECFQDSSCCNDFMEMCSLETTTLPLVTDNLEESDTSFGIFSTDLSSAIPHEELSSLETEIIMKNETSDVSTTISYEQPSNFDTEIVVGNNNVTTIPYEETNHFKTKQRRIDNFSEMSTVLKDEETSSVTEINGELVENNDSSTVKPKSSTSGMQNTTYDELNPHSLKNSHTTKKLFINTTSNSFQQNIQHNTGYIATIKVSSKNESNEENNTKKIENSTSTERSTIQMKRVTKLSTIKGNTHWILTDINFTSGFHDTKNATNVYKIFMKPTTTAWDGHLKTTLKVLNTSKSILKHTSKRMFNYSTTTESNRYVFYKGSATANVFYNNFTSTTKNSENSSSSEIKSLTTTTISFKNITVATLRPPTVAQSSSLTFESSEKFKFNYTHTHFQSDIPTTAVSGTLSTVPQTTLKFWENVNKNTKKPIPTKWKSKYKPKERLIFTAAASTRPHTSVIVAWVCLGVVFMTAVITSVVLYLKKRQRQRFSNGTEEADILYTSSDELLDFHLARPEGSS